ncbi:sulfurtransferase TusA family protein [Megasphaera paucivorans]|uniref:TusA-related sulfurtransferase n=1 Tax=Megasphaera paucivorans TaxID=349095 RepID=A0A1H0B2U3_9FIRM|nr:sulfurtransferase TusA family protein [Megasphaera paucivorans]SDN39936.1 TusA-related sulfurtransferase [Megasphaera paucivorans]
MKADNIIDITNVVCPVTFVKLKIELENMKTGKILEVILNEGEPIANIPRSLKDEGHKIIDVTNNDNGTYTLFVKKDGLV